MASDMFRGLISNITYMDILDIAVISFFTYIILLLLKGTKAAYMLISIFILLIFLGLSDMLGLRVTAWVLNNISGYLFVTLVVIFQPEIRRGLAFIGESNFFEKSGVSINRKLIEEIVRTANILANRQIGALIIIERRSKLDFFVSGGETIDSEVNKDLLLSLFFPYSPLHDGAVIISSGRIRKAGCILPLSKREDLPMMYGTRHRAAIGVTEETDAIAIVVSEERGAIAVARNGYISTDLNSEMLTNTLEQIFDNKNSTSRKDNN